MVTLSPDTAVMAMKRGDISAALIGGCNLNLKPQVIFNFLFLSCLLGFKVVRDLGYLIFYNSAY